MINLKNKGFTLIELLVVIAIIGILAGFIAIQMNGAVNVTNDTKKKTTLDTIKKTLIIDKVSSGSYPVESGCTIGSDCANLNPVVQKYLPTDLGGTYTYQSDGSNCTISTILSNGYSYQYDCLTRTYSTNTPVNAVCGSSAGANLSSSPVANLCNQGITSAVSGSGPWTWTCSGVYGGSNASCSTGSVPLNGTCGSANGSNYYVTPSANLCVDGNPSVVNGTGPWTWSCTGLNTGSTASCSASLSIDGTCGSSNGANLSSIPTTNLCNYGTASAVSGSGPWTWTCAGTNGGVSPSCSTGGLPVNGACGSSNGATLSSIPTTNLCNYGTASAVSGSGPWTWSCTGLNTGSTASCSASASLYTGAHTLANCTTAGGTVFSDGTNNMCKFTAGACPSGWTKYLNWTQTATLNGCPNPFNTAGSGFGCAITTYHTWANQAVESCTTASSGCNSSSECGYCCWSQAYTCTNVTAIGCY